MRKIKGDESMRLAPGLHRIGSDVVIAYLVEDAAGVTIVDAGLPGLWRELQEDREVMAHQVLADDLVLLACLDARIAAAEAKLAQLLPDTPRSKANGVAKPS